MPKISFPTDQRVARSMADKVKGITPLAEDDFNELASDQGRDFTMADLLKLAGVV